MGTNLTLQKYHWAWITIILVLIIAVLSIYTRDPVLGAETDHYLVDHLSYRPYLSKILCPNVIDSTDYMARPVSHFFENIDAHIFYFLYSLSIPSFISISTMVMLFILSAAIWFFATYYAKVPPIIATLMLALLWTNPNVFFAGNLFRDAKIAATFFFILAGLYSFRIISQNQPLRFRDFAIIFVLALLACLSDPQGFAFIAMLSSIAFVWALFTDSRPAYLSFLSGLFASITYLFLSINVLPKLVAQYTWFHAHSAFANYQQTDAAEHYIKYLWNGTLLHLDTIRFLFGNVPRVVIAIFLIMLCIAIFKLTRHGLLIGFCFILLMVENFVIDGLMVARHPPLMMPDVMRGGYYQLPSVVLVCVFMLFILPLVCKTFRVPQNVLAALLLVAIFANIIAIPYHKKVMRNSPFMHSVIASPFLRAELVSLSKITPTGPPLPYNARYASESRVSVYLFNPNLDMSTNLKYYINLSPIYNFLRSKKGLPYNKIKRHK
ncbi:MAG: hypothetical protein KBG22_03905 [Smithella sp.]|nr:hypothetical protein [Smithella sp.]HOU49679.1 hypothetical protein [Smithella sp.]HQG64469.1 hypothetical protein [Smithella sp.]HQH15740.1 hypothetical protein [Smithella sp.]HQI71811.1 hypothetical protein [Smithella sp.]